MTDKSIAVSNFAVVDDRYELSEREVICFQSHIDSSRECHTWNGRHDPKGYAWWSVRRGGLNKQVKAHRMSWSRVNGPLTPGMFILHRCGNRGCVNPAHLYEGDAKQNAQDAIRDGTFSGFQRRKTHCIRGHKFTPETSMLHKGGGRECKLCWKSRRADRLAKEGEKCPSCGEPTGAELLAKDECDAHIKSAEATRDSWEEK